MRAGDYVLGTDDDEVVRLGQQHEVWRPIARDAWQRAGVRGGSRVIDVGAGPGFATRDLVECVGPTGIVHAVERSERFVAVLEDETRRRATANVRRRLPSLLTASSFAIVEVRPLVYALRPQDPMWQWPAGFVRVGARRLSGLGRFDRHRLTAILRDIDAAEGDETTIMITPMMLEIIARRR